MAREESADLLLMPAATAADWATVLAHAEPLRVGAGLAVVGELAFFDGLPRSATLVAETEVEALRLDPAGFESLAELRA